MLGKAAHVQFIDDRLDGTDAGRLVVAPVECAVDDQTASGAAPVARGNAPACATRQRLGVGIQELLPGIEALQVRCRIGNACFQRITPCKRSRGMRRICLDNCYRPCTSCNACKRLVADNLSRFQRPSMSWLTGRLEKT
jgi:hypothetical protein